MSRNPSILEGGAAKTMSNVSRLVTALQAGGVCYWVPEDERMLVTKYVSKNGLYLPAEDSVFAYSKLTVSVPGGAPGIDVPTLDEDGNPMPSPTSPEYNPEIPTYGPVAVDPSTIPTVMPAIPGGPGSSISGIDPSTGLPTVAKVGNDGKISLKTVPTAMKIIRLPNKTHYTEGDKIDYTGIVCQLYLTEEDKAAGIPYTDEKYPDGIIPFPELMFPVETATLGNPDVKKMRNKDGTINAIRLTTHYETWFYDGMRKYWASNYLTVPFYTVFRSGQTRPAAISTGSEAVIYLTRYVGDNGMEELYAARESGSGDSFIPCEYEVSSFYPDGGWPNYATTTYHTTLGKFTRAPWNGRTGSINVPAPMSTSDPTKFDLNDFYASAEDIPVQWLSPYDSKTYEDVFTLEVDEREKQPDDDYHGSGGGDIDSEGSGGGSFDGDGSGGGGF